MNNLQFTKTNEELSEVDKKVMVDGMMAYHAQHGHSRKVEHSTITAKNEDNELVGVVIVSFLWNAMEIDSLWVNESYRGKGVGSKLMEMAEDEGRKRGSSFAHTNTFTYQAPDFYKKCGYIEFGRLDNFPEGCSLIYFRKSL